MAAREPERGDGRRVPGRFPIYVAVFSAIALGIVLALHEWSGEPLTLRAGTALPEPRPIADFEFLDEDGRPFERKNLEGQWSLLFTGFTHCPDVCPTTIALMAELRRRISRDDLQFVFVSVDPERDTPEVVAAYLAHFDPALVGATGSRAEMERFTVGARPRAGSKSRSRRRVHGGSLHRARTDRSQGAESPATSRHRTSAMRSRQTSRSCRADRQKGTRHL